MANKHPQFDALRCPECNDIVNPDGRCLDRDCTKFNTFVVKVTKEQSEQLAEFLYK